jgi:hypothetical protein
LPAVPRTRVKSYSDGLRNVRREKLAKVELESKTLGKYEHI